MVLGRMISDGEPTLFSRLEMAVMKIDTGMKAIPEADRPREKLHALGAAALSNAELLAILLCTGSQVLSVLDLCRKVMRSVKDDPKCLSEKTADELCQFKGIGDAKAATLMAAIELGKLAAG